MVKYSPSWDVPDQVNRTAEGGLDAQPGVSIVAQVIINPNVVATVIGLDRVVRRPGQIIVVDVNTEAESGEIFDRGHVVVGDGDRIAEPADSVVPDDVALAIHVDAGV